MKTHISMHAPAIAGRLDKRMAEIEDLNDYILAFQLNYRDNHTIYHLCNIEEIWFQNEYVEIIQKNSTYSYFVYEEINEWHIIRNEDLNDLWKWEL